MACTERVKSKYKYSGLSKKKINEEDKKHNYQTNQNLHLMKALNEHHVDLV